MEEELAVEGVKKELEEHVMDHDDLLKKVAAEVVEELEV